MTFCTVNFHLMSKSGIKVPRIAIGTLNDLNKGPGPALGEPGCRDFAVSRNTASRALPDVPNVTTRPHMSGRGRGSVEGW